MKSRGFSIIELIVVITVISILLVMGVVSLVGSEVNARDSERKLDIETIAMHLENYHKIGVNGSENYGQYPFVGIDGLIGNEALWLDNIDDKALKAPNATTSSLFAATNSNQTTAGVTPQPTTNQYIYQPIATDGSLCDNLPSTEECRKFNIFYRLEADDSVYVYTSKNQ